MIKVERLHTAAQVTLPFCPLSHRERKRRRLGERREERGGSTVRSWLAYLSTRRRGEAAEEQQKQ